MDIFQLSKPSPPLCQEHCYQKSVSVFAVQVCYTYSKLTHCILVPQHTMNYYFLLTRHRNAFAYLRVSITLKTKLAASSCVYTCDGMDFLSTECGGESAFNVFLTG